MHRQRHDDVHTQCYPSAGGKILSIAGIALIAAGVLLILLCIPCWAWLAVIGVGLIIAGVVLLRRG